MSKAPAREAGRRDELDRRAEIVAEAQAEIDRGLARLVDERRRLEDERAQLERERTSLQDEVWEAREQARRAAEAMIALESARAREAAELDEARRELEALSGTHFSTTAGKRLEQLHRELVDAHDVIHSMQQTRVWRIGAAWWRLRDRLLGRRRSLDSPR